MRVVLERVNEQKKIQAIKCLRAATGMGLKDAKNVIDEVAAGRECVVELSSAPRLDALVADGYISFRVARPPFEIDAFVEVLSRFPSETRVGDLVATLRPLRDLTDANRTR